MAVRLKRWAALLAFEVAGSRSASIRAASSGIVGNPVLLVAGNTRNVVPGRPSFGGRLTSCQRVSSQAFVIAGCPSFGGPLTRGDSRSLK